MQQIAYSIRDNATNPPTYWRGSAIIQWGTSGQLYKTKALAQAAIKRNAIAWAGKEIEIVEITRVDPVAAARAAHAARALETK